MHNKILIITGPTASGKTQLSEMISKKIECEIVNADVGQFYSVLSVGTAKPALDTVAYKHHLFNLLDTPEDLSVVQYRKLVATTVQNICSTSKKPLIVGGSLFYIKSLFFPPLELSVSDNNVQRVDLSELSQYQRWELLQKIDLERSIQIHPNDSYRINRALEIWQKTGQKPSAYKPRFNPILHADIVFVCPSTDIMNKRINQRTEQMIYSDGWIEEAKTLLGTEWEDFVISKGLIGYKEIFDWINSGENKNKVKDLVSLIQTKTIQYAKRQRTFWRSLKNELNHNSDKFKINISEIEQASDFLPT